MTATGSAPGASGWAGQPPAWAPGGREAMAAGQAGVPATGRNAIGAAPVGAHGPVPAAVDALLPLPGERADRRPTRVASLEPCPADPGQTPAGQPAARDDEPAALCAALLHEETA